MNPYIELTIGQYTIDQLPLSAFSLNGQVSVKGAFGGGLCAMAGIYMPFIDTCPFYNFADKVIDRFPTTQNIWKYLLNYILSMKINIINLPTHFIIVPILF